jgi:hypothetical protein
MVMKKTLLLAILAIVAASCSTTTTFIIHPYYAYDDRTKLCYAFVSSETGLTEVPCTDEVKALAGVETAQ